MDEKDTIESKVIDKKDKMNSKIEDKKEKMNSKIEDSKGKVNEKVEQGKNIADKVAIDLGKSMDGFIVNMKGVQKIIDEKISEYKNATVHSLDIDLIEDENKYYVKVAVPGIDKDNIDIEAGDKDLSIKCNFTPFTEELEDVENPEILIEELKTGKCAKKITFLNEIDIENISAKFKNGIIFITIAKVQTQKNKINVE